MAFMERVVLFLLLLLFLLEEPSGTAAIVEKLLPGAHVGPIETSKGWLPSRVTAKKSIT
jgi:hypothetical protein